MNRQSWTSEVPSLSFRKTKLSVNWSLSTVSMTGLKSPANLKKIIGSVPAQASSVENAGTITSTPQ